MENDLLGEGGLGLQDGDSVFVERGPPLNAGELLVRCAWCIPEELDAAGGGDPEGSDFRHPSPPASADPTGHAAGLEPEEGRGETRRRTRRSVSFAMASEVAVFGDGGMDAEIAELAASARSRSRSRSRSKTNLRGSPAAYLFRFSPKQAATSAGFVTAATWGVMVTFGWLQRGEDAGSGSVMKTSATTWRR